ncbi:MAG: valine--tRNA ligase [Phycisphaerae bacterium]
MAKGESKSYDPASVEGRIFQSWQQQGAFSPEVGKDGPHFCMVIPPPNVTGALHLGHALNNTLQDILIRRNRMAGKNTLWMVGTDHAGIATQATVEKTIRKQEGKSRDDLGREELVRRIWEWKERFGGRIVEQLKLMGCSCDYSRERFTLDETCAKAVRHTFFKLFRDGLIYRGKRLVNLDTQLQTAVADDEVYHETVKGHMWHFRYPIVGEHRPPAGSENQSLTTGGTPMLPHDAVFGRDYVVVATTRPETMLGDTAVAVHPDPAAALEQAEADLREKLAAASEKEQDEVQAALDDVAERRKSLMPTLLKLRDMARDGRKVTLPLVNREIPLLCDEWAKPELGSGCVKITPAHDPNDYEVGLRHDLPMVNVLTKDGHVAEIVEPDGRVNENSSRYAGLKFATAGRKRVVEDMEAGGFVERIEDRQIEIGHSDRSQAAIEPYLSDQWFVKMGDLEPEHAAKVEGLRHHAPGLAQMAIDAVKRGDVRFHPSRYEKTYVDWLSEKRDWCISRQLWWGHRIPVWTRRFHLTEKNWTDEFLRVGMDDLLDYNWAGPEQLSICVVNAGNGATVSNPKHEFFPVVSKSEGEYIFHICLKQDDPKLVKQLEQSGFVQDPDVLDTWFSSALWPHSTLGWPDADPESSNNLLNTFYPTDVLSTAREIITLWVARMVMTGLYNVGKIPFTDVVIHPVIQDGQGRKMSKSLGNGVDPVDIIDKYGADALRFTLADLATETQDIRMPVTREKLPDGREINISPKFEKGRNFCNKLWQAATGFVIPNLEGYTPVELDVEALGLEDRWILSRLAACVANVDEALARYRFSEAINVLYHFMWDDYCSDYIEMNKSRLDGTDRGAAQQVLAFVLDQLLRMLHPFVPFVTEATWSELNTAAPQRGIGTLSEGEPALISAAWVTTEASWRNDAVESQMGSLQAIIQVARESRSFVNDYRGRAKQPTIRTLPRVVVVADSETIDLVDRHGSFVKKLAGCDSLEASTSGTKPRGARSYLAGSLQVYVPVADLIDVEQVRAAEEKKLEETHAALARAKKQLSNENFVNRADPAVVEQARQRAADLSRKIETIQQHLAEWS